jgi:predicted dithiol-disulfide oxidoreductase (DUF899 family)
MQPHKIVSREEWIAARKAHMAHEKEFTKARDRLAEERRALPWVRVDKDYAFDGPNGVVKLADLFEGRPQLVVQHFMFAPEWKQGCAHCSFWADHFDSVNTHVGQRDTTFVVISRAPRKKIRAFQKRMGWKFKWVSSSATDFNFDYRVSFTADELEKKEAVYNFKTIRPGMPEREGASVFYKDPAGRVFHTYSTYARGIDMLNTAYHYIDLAPKGRDEGDRNQFWVRRHDEYGR